MKDHYGSIKAKGISPKYENPKKIEKVDDLSTVGFVLTKDQANELIDALQKAIQDPAISKMFVTGFRKTCQVTVTADKP